MKTNKKIKIINKNLDKETYAKYEDFIYDTCHVLHCGLEEDVFIKVILENQRKGYHSEHIGGEASKKGKNFVIRIFSVNFRSNDEEYIKHTLEETLYHEFTHVYDIIKTHKNPDCKFKPDTKLRSLSEHILQLGFNFWTEFHAYNSAMYKFNQEVGPSSFYSIYKSYKALKSEFEDLSILDNSKENDKLIQDYLNRAQEFVYLLARYCAASHYKNFNIKQYNKKTEADELYIFIAKFIYEATILCNNLYIGMFGKRQEKKLFNLGKLVYKLTRELGIGYKY